MSTKTKPDANQPRETSSKSANHPKRSEKTSKPVNETIDDREKHRKRRTYVPKDPIYNVYLCYFNTNVPRLDFEVGLLIATDERIIRKGHYYEVKGPRPARGYKDRLEYHLYYSIIKSPENSMNFRKLAHVGRMSESKLYLALRIAEEIPPPQVVLSYTGEPPNCIDWMNNFLFELARFKVVDFEPDFETPKKKRVLVHPSLMSPDELVDVGMSPALSDRYVPPSELGSRSRRNQNNSQSKNDETHQQPSSSKKEPSNNELSSSNKSELATPSGSSSKQARRSNQRDKSGAASKSGKIPSSSKQGKDDSKHKHLSIRRFFSKK